VRDDAPGMTHDRDSKGRERTKQVGVHGPNIW